MLQINQTNHISQVLVAWWEEAGLSVEALSFVDGGGDNAYIVLKIADLCLRQILESIIR